MKWPQHKNPSTVDRTAHAPYNFVPLPEEVVTVSDLRSQDRYYEDRLTGYLDCYLETKSPLYVRCGLTPEEFAQGKESKDLADFFYVDPDRKSPIIPGSSLRGMLRVLVEMVGYAKVQPVSRQKLFYRAVADQMTTLRESYHQQMQSVRAGYVERNGDDYAIRPAKAIDGNIFYKVTERVLEEGGVSFVSIFASNYHPQYVPCWFRPSDKFPDSVGKVAPEPKSGYQKGTLVCSGPFGKKKRKHWIVPEKDDRADVVPIPENVVREYIDTLTPHQKQEPPFSAKTGCLVEGHPIFYLEEGGEVIDFGPTRHFRVAYREPGKTTALSARDFVPFALRNPDDIDLAEAMFGYVEPEAKKARKDVALAGRVSVSDALLEENQPLDAIWLAGSRDKVVTPRILSGPKPTTFAHYLTQQKPDRIKVRGKRGDRHILDLSHYASPTPGETVIRGHKLYWHEGDVGRDQIAETEEVGPNDTQHTRFKPVRSGVRFGFRIHFENLSDVELGALLWALTLPGPKEYCHKLGMGKPLGMGSAKIESELHLTDRLTRYRELFDSDTWELGQKDMDVASRQRQALNAFEQAILQNDYLNPGGKAQSLAEIPRVKTLLALLSWPGPSPEKTDYMTDLKEFTERKVLPTPLAVVGEGVAPSPPAPAGEGEPAPSSGRCTGRVMWFNDQKGYGFIQVDESQEEVFVHYTDIKGKGFRTLNENDRVEFSIEEDAKGRRAVDVQGVEANP